MYSVDLPLEPLHICVVGRCYPPQAFDRIEDAERRTHLQKIAEETEEDFCNLIDTIKTFGVHIIRPYASELTDIDNIASPASMKPRDALRMIGNDFYVYPHNNFIETKNWNRSIYEQLKGSSWPTEFVAYEQLPDWIKRECTAVLNFTYDPDADIIPNETNWWQPIVNVVEGANNAIVHQKPAEIAEPNDTLVIDSKNIVVSEPFELLGYDYTVHVCEFRHKNFWNCDISNLTLDIDRTVIQ
ncbi:hypothetical protein OAP74_00025 [bacterium]|nr:hypothetical protein [bacterium]